MTPPTWLYWPAAGGGGGGLWTPAELGSLVGWWDASDPLTLFDATFGGSTPANNGQVARWEDKSGNGNDLTQTATASRPILKAGLLNDLNVVNFSDDYLAAASTVVWRNIVGGTIYAVIRESEYPSVGRQGVSIKTAGTQFTMATLASGQEAGKYNTGGRRLNTNAYQRVSSGVNASTAAFTIQGGLFDYNNTTLQQYINGTLSGMTTAFQSAGATVDNNTTIGLGGLAEGLSSRNGNYAEVLVCHALLAEADRQRLEGYLAHKWGLEGNLPPGHDHKTSPP